MSPPMTAALISTHNSCPCLREQYAVVVGCRSVLERLTVWETRRVYVVDAESRVVKAVISLSDVARYLFF